VATIVEAPGAGWGSPRTLLSFIGVALLLSAFVAIEQRSAHPLVRLGILRSGALVRANLAAMAVVGSYFGFQFIVTIYLQSVLGWSPLETALALLPAGVLVAFGAPRMAPVIVRYGTGSAITASLFAFALGYVLFLGIGADPSYGLAILPTVLLAGVGFAVGFPALNIQATAGVADGEQGLASGLVNTSFQVGGAVVTAVVSAVVTSGSGGLATLSSLDDGVIVIITSASMGLLVTAFGGFAWARARLAPATR
jgi:predicted MFS family arabinose efflux permease